jgi:7,8-dihydropterin-6-yl-methyl-4-(beta-D-ribofuranosyl)aminobenzene 5'-phosphate synthase
MPAMMLSALQAAGPVVKTLKVTVLSTMLAGDPGRGIGEWGFAALIEADGQRLLLDTGARAETVHENALELGIDLSAVPELVLTHNHSDHTGGLLTLRRELMKKDPKALSRAHAGKGILLSRLTAQGREANGLLPLKADYEALGGSVVEHAGPVQLLPGVWLTGPVPRPHPERNWSGSLRLQTSSGAIEDTLPEDSSVVIDTAQGLVVVSGCGHAGIVNTLEYARKAVKPAPIHAVIGGFHLFAANDERLDWTAAKLKEMAVGHLLGAHCTGIEAVFRLREKAGLSRRTAVVGTVGASFTLGAGLEPSAWPAFSGALFLLFFHRTERARFFVTSLTKRGGCGARAVHSASGPKNR